MFDICLDVQLIEAHISLTKSDQKDHCLFCTEINLVNDYEFILFNCVFDLMVDNDLLGLTLYCYATSCQATFIEYICLTIFYCTAKRLLK